MSRTITLSLMVGLLFTLTVNDAEARVVYKKVYTRVAVPGYVTTADITACRHATRFVRPLAVKRARYDRCIRIKKDARATTRLVVSTRRVVVPTAHHPVRRPVVIHKAPHKVQRPAIRTRPPRAKRPVVVRKARTKTVVHKRVVRKAPAKRTRRR